MLLLAGLGNPGPRYANNRHNIGFMAVDEIVRRHGFGPFRRRFQSDISEGRIGSEKLLAQKPLQYMNRSGLPVKQAADFYKLAPEEIIVIYDEIDLAPGKMRAKKGGGHGGHIDVHVACQRNPNRLHALALEDALHEQQPVPVERRGVVD